MTQFLTVKTNTDSTELFKKSIDDFCRELSLLGHKIQGYRNDDVHGFKNLSEDEQQKSLSLLQKYLAIYNEAMLDRIRPEHESSLLWHALKKWGYRPTGDLFDKIESDDFIEVYNSDNIQIHRSFNYFKLSSYSLEDIFINPWQSLYRRDPLYSDRISEIIRDIFSEKLRQTVFADLKNHHLIENLSSEKRTYMASHNYFSPLKDQNNRQTAFVVLSKAMLTSTSAETTPNPINQ